MGGDEGGTTINFNRYVVLRIRSKWNAGYSIITPYIIFIPEQTVASV